MQTPRIVLIFEFKVIDTPRIIFMKRFLFIVLFLAPLLVVSQTKIGLKFSPLIASSRIDLISDTLDVESGGAALKFGLGLIVDHSFSDTYAFSTGLLIVPKRVNIDLRAENEGTIPNAEEEYNLQYLQLPLTLKLFTNEVIPDMNIFFQVGGAVEFKIDDRPLEEEYVLIDQFNPIDFVASIGVGTEYRVGINTTLFGGFSFQRGLINVVNETEPRDIDLKIRNTVFSIDFGIKF